VFKVKPDDRKIFTGLQSTTHPALANLLTEMLTRDLFAVSNLVFIYKFILSFFLLLKLYVRLRGLKYHLLTDSLTYLDK